MRVLYVWDADYPWDVRTEKVCAALTSEGFEVHIAARNRAGLSERELLPEATVHRMPRLEWAGRKLNGALGFPAFINPRWIRHIARTAREVKADVLIVRDLPLCPTSIWVGRALDLPVVLDMAENYPAMIRAVWNAGRQGRFDYLVRNPTFVSAIERYCLSRVDRVLVVVEESGERLEQLGVSRDRIDVVSNTPPRAHALEPLRQNQAGGPLEVVYLGLMEIPRGVGELIAATRILLDRGLNVRLQLIGDGRDRSVFEQEAEKLGLSPSEVVFLGQKPRDEAIERVRGADIGVVPHHADEAWNTTIPNKLFDYMAAGLPVVSSDALPCARILGETGAGRLFRSQDAQSLAAAIESLGEPSARQTCGDAGRKAILEKYSWEADVCVLHKAIDAVVGRPARERNLTLRASASSELETAMAAERGR